MPETAEPGDHPQRQQRVTPDDEEVVLPADQLRGDLQHLRPHADHGRLHRGEDTSVGAHRGVGGGAGVGQGPPVEFARGSHR